MKGRRRAEGWGGGAAFGAKSKSSRVEKVRELVSLEYVLGEYNATTDRDTD
jgi:hypothetical protein